MAQGLLKWRPTVLFPGILLAQAKLQRNCWLETISFLILVKSKGGDTKADSWGLGGGGGGRKKENREEITLKWELVKVLRPQF